MGNIAPVFGGVVEKGELVLNQPDLFAGYLRSLSGKKVVVTVKQERKHRSLPQNNYYWGVVIPLLMDHTGYEKNEMHDAMRVKFLSIEEKGLMIVGSTTNLSTKEFMEYVEQITRWAAQEMGVVIPPPNGVDYND